MLRTHSRFKLLPIKLYCREINTTLQMRVINLFYIEFILNFLYNYQRIIQLNYTLAEERGVNF